MAAARSIEFQTSGSRAGSRASVDTVDTVLAGDNSPVEGEHSQAGPQQRSATQYRDRRQLVLALRKLRCYSDCITSCPACPACSARPTAPPAEAVRACEVGSKRGQ